MAVRLRVDPVACDGYGHCHELAGEIVGLDEWGYPILSDHELSPEEIKLAELAIKQCPRRALFLQAVEPATIRRAAR